jgi:AcrR family transcriptional regulator
MLSRPPLATTPPPGTGTAGHRTSGRRAPGRPPGGVLDRSRITQAGLALIGQAGYSGLTMASLARHLNVSKSALYNHVTSKDDILRLIEEHVIAQVDVTAFTTHPWEEAVRVWAFSYRDVFSRHTPLIPVIAVLPVTNAPKTLAMYEAVSNGFRSAKNPQPAHHPRNRCPGILHLRSRLRRQRTPQHLRTRYPRRLCPQLHLRRHPTRPPRAPKPRRYRLHAGLEHNDPRNRKPPNSI